MIASQYIRPSSVVVYSNNVELGHNGGGNTIKIGKVDGDTLAFFGATGTSRPTPTQETEGVTLGTGVDDATFTGNTGGSNAYTVSDIVKILKGYGLLKD